MIKVIRKKLPKRINIDSIYVRVAMYLLALLVVPMVLMVLWLLDCSWVRDLVSVLLRNQVLQSALVIFILTIPVVTLTWILKNHDVTRQQAETLFSNALQLLFKDGDKAGNAAGLKELIRLKQKGGIDADRIDLITSSKVDWEGVNLVDANLQGANLRGANFQGANLQGVNLRDADLQGADFQGANLREADLQGADFQYAVLQRAHLQSSTLKGANLICANFQHAELAYTDLRACLVCAELQGADLQDSDLRGADLQDAQLQDARIRHANFQGAFYGDGTRLPAGFDPESLGMIKAQPPSDELEF